MLIVSGDVSDDLPSLEEALVTLAGKFAHIFYVPGNHELWCRESDRCGWQGGLRGGPPRLYPSSMHIQPGMHVMLACGAFG